MSVSPRGASHLFLFIAEGLPLLGEQLCTLADRDVLEITAGLAADGELHKRGGSPLDLAFILDDRPLLRGLRIQAAAQPSASKVGDSNFADVVRLDPAFVLCSSSLVGCVNQVIVVLFVLAKDIVEYRPRSPSLRYVPQSH